MSVFRKEIEKDISEMISGRQLIRREYRRPGQSEYFYLTKNADGSHNQIDVPDDFGRKWIGKTLPDKIPDNYEITEDMVEHPEKYYIWYTMGDSKVRSEHAKRHGKIFKWDIPPQGGHPGEDYNCRCLAIPYKPPYNKRKNLNYIVDNINLLQGKVDLLNAEIAIMSSWLEAIKEKEINIYKKNQRKFYRRSKKWY